MGNLFAQKLAVSHSQSMKCLLHRVFCHPQLIPDLGLRRMLGFIGKQRLQPIEQQPSPASAVILLQKRQNLIEDGDCPLPLVNLVGSQACDRLRLKAPVCLNFVERNWSFASASLDRSRPLSLVREKVFHRDEQIGTQPPFLLPRCIEVAPL